METEEIKVIPKEEEWLFDPKNKELVEHIRECLKQKATIDYETVKKRIKAAKNKALKKK